MDTIERDELLTDITRETLGAYQKSHEKEWDENITTPEGVVRHEKQPIHTNTFSGGDTTMPEKTAKTIYQKLLEFQKKDITIKRDGENPHFRSTYVTLNEVLDKVKKPLNELGILMLQVPEKDGLRTRLVDTDSLEAVECFMPYSEESTTAQKLGGNLTYARRYSLIALLGLEDEDDDGNVASDAPVILRKPGKPTDKQIKFLKDLFSQKVGKMPKPECFANLDFDTAKKTIDTLIKKPQLDMPIINTDDDISIAGDDVLKQTTLDI